MFVSRCFKQRASDLFKSFAFTSVRMKANGVPKEEVPLMDLCGKIVLVTEGTHGVGLALTKELLKKNVAKVIVTGKINPADDTLKMHQNEISHLQTFAKDQWKNKQEVQNMFKFIMNQFGSLDIFFNNAETDVLDEIIDVNMVSKIQSIISACEIMEPDSVVINHTSALGLELVGGHYVHSAASAGFVAASTAFSALTPNNKYIPKIRMMTMCSESITPIPAHDLATLAIDEREMGCRSIAPIPVQSTGRVIDEHEMQEDICRLELSIAKSAVYLMEYGTNESTWLHLKNGSLNTVEFPSLSEFTERFEPIVDGKLYD